MGIVILKVFPKLKNIFCKYCSESHENVVIVFPEVDQAILRKARDDLYLFGDTSSIYKLFKDVIDDAIDIQNMIKEEEYEGNIEQDVDETVELTSALNSDVTIAEETIAESDFIDSPETSCRILLENGKKYDKKEGPVAKFEEAQN